jgi:hypothetical protein
MQMQMDDFISFHRSSMENSRINDTGIRQTIQFYVAKFIFLTQRIFLPIYLGFSVFQTLFFFLVAELTAGCLFGYFSQITHVQPKVLWPSEKPIDRDWGELQVNLKIKKRLKQLLIFHMIHFFGHTLVDI